MDRGSGDGQTGLVAAILGVAAAATVGISLGFIYRMAMMNPDNIKEITQAVIGVLFIVGTGYILVAAPWVQPAIVTTPLGLILGFYFGAKVGAEQPQVKP